MKKGLLWLICLMLCSCAYAQEVDPAPIYNFAAEYGARELAQNVYESAVTGKSSAWKSVLNWVKAEMIQPVWQVAGIMLSSIVPAVLLSVLRACMPYANGGCEGACFLLRLLLLLGYADIAQMTFVSTEECMMGVKKLVEAISPGIAAMLASMGMNGTSALVSPAAALAGGIAENVFLKYGLMLCKIALCSALAGNMSDVVDLRRFTELMKKTANWGAGLAITIFTGLIALQGNLTETVDGLGVRTAKFAVESAAPMIGSGASDVWDSLVSGVMITKNAFGMSGMTALLAAGIRPVVCCAASILALNLIAAFLELFGERENAKAAEQIGGICQMALSLATASLVIGVVLLGTAMHIGRSVLI